MSKNDDYTTENLLDYLIIKNIKNFLAQIYQDKQVRVFLNKINFIGKLEEDDGATLFVIAAKQQKTILNFPLDSLIVIQ